MGMRLTAGPGLWNDEAAYQRAIEEAKDKAARERKSHEPKYGLGPTGMPTWKVDGKPVTIKEDGSWEFIPEPKKAPRQNPHNPKWWNKHRSNGNSGGGPRPKRPIYLPESAGATAAQKARKEFYDLPAGAVYGGGSYTGPNALKPEHMWSESERNDPAFVSAARAAQAAYIRDGVTPGNLEEQAANALNTVGIHAAAGQIAGNIAGLGQAALGIGNEPLVYNVYDQGANGDWAMYGPGIRQAQQQQNAMDAKYQYADNWDELHAADRERDRVNRMPPGLQREYLAQQGSQEATDSDQDAAIEQEIYRLLGAGYFQG